MCILGNGVETIMTHIVPVCHYTQFFFIFVHAGIGIFQAPTNLRTTLSKYQYSCVEYKINAANDRCNSLFYLSNFVPIFHRIRFITYNFDERFRALARMINSEMIGNFLLNQLKFYIRNCIVKNLFHSQT